MRMADLEFSIYLFTTCVKASTSNRGEVKAEGCD